MELCTCKDKKSEWAQEVYANGHGNCKHCGKRMPKFAPKREEE